MDIVKLFETEYFILSILIIPFLILLLSFFKDESGILKVIKYLLTIPSIISFVYFVYKHFFGNSGGWGSAGYLFLSFFSFIYISLNLCTIYFTRNLVNSKYKKVIILSIISIIGFILLFVVACIVVYNTSEIDMKKYEESFEYSVAGGYDYPIAKVYNDKLYFADYSDNKKLVMADLDGSNKEILVNRVIQSIAGIIEEKIYYESENMKCVYDINEKRNNCNENFPKFNDYYSDSAFAFVSYKYSYIYDYKNNIIYSLCDDNFICMGEEKLYFIGDYDSNVLVGVNDSDLYIIQENNKGNDSQIVKYSIKDKRIIDKIYFNENFSLKGFLYNDYGIIIASNENLILINYNDFSLKYLGDNFYCIDDIYLKDNFLSIVSFNRDLYVYNNIRMILYTIDMNDFSYSENELLNNYNKKFYDFDNGKLYYLDEDINSIDIAEDFSQHKKNEKLSLSDVKNSK